MSARSHVVYAKFAHGDARPLTRPLTRSQTRARRHCSPPHAPLARSRRQLIGATLGTDLPPDTTSSTGARLLRRSALSGDGRGHGHFAGDRAIGSGHRPPPRVGVGRGEAFPADDKHMLNSGPVSRSADSSSEGTAAWAQMQPSGSSSSDSGETRRASAPKHRQRFLSVRPGGWSRTPVNSSSTRLTLTLDGVAQWVTPPGDHAVPVPISTYYYKLFYNFTYISIAAARALARARVCILYSYGCPALGWHSGVRCVLSLYLAATSASKVW